MADAPLAGLTIVITRPPEQAAPTVHALRAAGAAVLEYPVLDIVAIAATPPRLGKGAYAAIFVSANAVQHGTALVRDIARHSPALIVFAIGNATAAALREAGFENVVSPQQSSDSEGLLALLQLQTEQVKGQHVVLVRGKSAGGGRKLIEETLSARGAGVHAVECYERRVATPSSEQGAALLAALQSPRKPAVMALSVETLDNLLDTLTGVDRAAGDLLRSATLLVPHARVAAAARERGFANVVEVPLSTEPLIAALTTLKHHIGKSSVASPSG
jgi:uroporphyrinogen-III synthase